MPRRTIQPDQLATSPATPTRSLNTKSTAEILKTAREKQGLSIDQVSQAINIRPSLLKSIEEGHLVGLTDPLYLKGFIRSYAHYVGLSDDEVMPFFRRDYDTQAHQQQLTQPLAPIEPRKSWLTPGWMIVGFLAIALIAVTGYAYQQYVSVTLSPELTLSQPADQTQTSDSQIVASGHTDPDSILTLNGQKLQLNPQGDFNATIGLATGSNQLTFTATNKLGRSSTIKRTIISSYTLATIPTPTIASSSAIPHGSSSATIDQPASTPIPLTLTVTIGSNPAWVEITVDGQDAFSGVLLPGANQTFTASAHIHLKTGNAGSTKVRLKGQDLGALGADNQTVEKDYTQ